MIDLDRDLSEMLADRDFGEWVDVAGAAVRAIYLGPYVQTLDAEGYAPTLVVRTGDVEGVKHGDHVSRPDGLFRVRGVQPSTRGLTRLVLESAD